MRFGEIKRENELLPSEVKKGDQVAVVGPWNFHREANRSIDHTVDQYYIEVWTVAAIGKKLMRLSRDNDNYKHNVYLTERGAEGSRFTGFETFIAKPEAAEALVNELFATDSKSTAEMGGIVYRNV